MQEILRHFIVDFAMEAVRYLAFAGTTFLLFWVLFKKRFFHRVIQRKLPDAANLRREFVFSLMSIVIFSIIGVGVFLLVKNGYGQMYFSIPKYGWAYFIASIFLCILIHDAYFYFTHRLMHHPALFRHVHLIHHKSTNPSPWAAYSFHPLEAFVQGLIGPLLVISLPVHPAALLSFAIFQISYNVFGHLSIELFPKGFTKSFMFWHNSSTHHNMHHKYFNCHYSIYFNWWDRLFGTMHPKYDETFEEVAAREKDSTAAAASEGSVAVQRS